MGARPGWAGRGRRRRRLTNGKAWGDRGPCPRALGVTGLVLALGGRSLVPAVDRVGANVGQIPEQGIERGGQGQRTDAVWRPQAPPKEGAELGCIRRPALPPSAFRASPRLSADARPCPGDGFAAGRLSTPTQNGQPLSVGLFVFRGAPRRAGLRAILPVPGEAVTEPFSHGFAPLLPSLLSKHWPTGLFWHRHIPRPVSRLYVCRQDRFAVTSAPRSGEKTGDQGLRRRSDGQEGSGRGTRRRGQQPLAVGQGVERRRRQ